MSMEAPAKPRHPAMYADVYVESPSDIPRKEHWAVITGSSIFIPGDERSRTNPGHGYPESTERYIGYAAYFDEESFKLALAKESNAVGIHVAGIYGTKTVTEAVKL